VAIGVVALLVNALIAAVAVPQIQYRLQLVTRAAVNWALELLLLVLQHMEACVGVETMVLNIYSSWLLAWWVPGSSCYSCTLALLFATFLVPNLIDACQVR